MAKGISKIKINNFRGASKPFEVDLDTNLPMVMLFGESGTGKTTIVDALDFIGNGKVGSIAMRSSTTPKQHLPTIGKKPEDLSVHVVLDGQTWTAKLAGGKPSVSPPTGYSFPPTFVLRRAQLLSLIEAQPAERYKELQRFINVEGVEKSEAALDGAIKNVK